MGDHGNGEKGDTVLPRLPTGTVSTDTPESDSGRIRLTTPDGFHLVFQCFSQFFLTFGSATGVY